MRLELVWARNFLLGEDPLVKGLAEKRGGGSARWVPLEGSEDDALEVFVEIRDEITDCGKRIHCDLGERLGRDVLAEKSLERKKLIQHETEGKHVAPPVDGKASELLGAHVVLLSDANSVRCRVN